MIYNIKYRPLKAFLLATETSSFTEAANLLGVTQPSFSALIRDLEDTLGIALFERTTRRVSLTAEGVLFCGLIKQSIDDLEQAYRNMLDLSANHRNSLVIGALPSTALTVLPSVLGALRKTQPALRIRVVEAHHDDLMTMVRTSQVEFALSALLEEVDEMETIPLLDDVFCVVYPPEHPISKQDSLYLEDLVPYDLILLSKGSSARNLYEKAVAEVTTRAGLRVDTTHMGTAIRFVHQGMGVAVLPRLALQSLNLNGLIYKPLADPVAHRKIGLVHQKKQTLTRAGADFLSQLKACLGEMNLTI